MPQTAVRTSVGSFSTTTSGPVTVVGSTSTAAVVTPGAYGWDLGEQAAATRYLKAVEDAVYSHIRAIRSLGRTRINTAEIAMALSIPQRDVDRAVASLRGRGVKNVA